jgi:exo-beta-1,3-glucanase (GH17 family)
VSAAAVQREGRLLALPALAAVVLAAFVFWRWLGEEVALPEVPGGRLHCLSYTPFEPGDLGATTPGRVSAARVNDDLGKLRAYTGCLRVYTPLGNTPRVLEAASRLGFRVLLGAWIGTDQEQNEKEVRAALELARLYPQTVTAIVVGNEVLLRREMAPAQLAAFIGEVKSESPVPVAYADVAHFIEVNPVVAEAADLLLIHLLPYWDDPRPPPVEEAVTQVLKSHEDFRRRFPSKELWIGETGWPSKGRRRGPGKPSLVNQARFVREFAARATALGIPYNLIEAIDQPWKRPPEGTVGGYWGILDERRRTKFALSGPVSGVPDWRARGLASSAIGAAWLGFALRTRRAPAGWLTAAATALALGLALAFQWDYVVTTSLSPWGWLRGAIAAALSLVAAALLMAPENAPAAPLAALGGALARPAGLLRSPGLRMGAFVALVLLPAAWVSLTLGFAPRHRDIPLAQFALPAAALAAMAWRSRTLAGSDRREEAMLAAILLFGGILQAEPDNPESVGWLAICALLAAPWLASLRSELARVRRFFTDARQSQQQREHS